MPSVVVEARGCRGCSLCVDECPVDVFDVEAQPDGGQLAWAARVDDCVGCFACYHICPSQCIRITDVPLQRPFYRVEENTRFVDRFLQTGAVTTASLGVDDWEDAYRDVSSTLVALVDSVVDNVGSVAVVGRLAGQVAASHFPEVYEEPDLRGVLRRLADRFRDCFPFHYEFQDDGIHFTFTDCALNRIVEEQTGESVGDARQCELFHTYLSGLVGAYSGDRYRPKVMLAGPRCEVRLVSFGAR